MTNLYVNYCDLTSIYSVNWCNKDIFYCVIVFLLTLRVCSFQWFVLFAPIQADVYESYKVFSLRVCSFQRFVLFVLIQTDGYESYNAFSFKDLKRNTGVYLRHQLHCGESLYRWADLWIFETYLLNCPW